MSPFHNTTCNNMPPFIELQKQQGLYRQDATFHLTIMTPPFGEKWKEPTDFCSETTASCLIELQITEDCCQKSKGKAWFSLNLVSTFLVPMAKHDNLKE